VAAIRHHARALATSCFAADAAISLGLATTLSLATALGLTTTLSIAITTAISAFATATFVTLAATTL